MNPHLVFPVGAALLMCLAGRVSAQSPGLMRAAIERHQSVSLHNWRFDRVRNVDGQEMRERCIGVDYRKANCRLRLVDGEPPDDKALERYAKDVGQPVEKNLPTIDPANYIDVATLTGQGDDGPLALYAFTQPVDDDDDPSAEGKPQGTAAVHREEGFIRRIGVRNTEPFKPATGVKISEFNLTFEFVEVDEAVFASRVSLKAKGRAFGLKKIEQNETVMFENFVAPY